MTAGCSTTGARIGQATLQLRHPSTGAGRADPRVNAEEFDWQWRAVMTHATEALDLTEVHRVLEGWRRVAWLTTAQGPESYQRLLATTEHRLRTRELPADSVSLEDMKALIAARLAAQR